MAVALFLALSPTAYGATPGGLLSFTWLSRLLQDAVSDSPRFNTLFSIAPIVAYLGWRGMALGASPPKIEPTLRRYTLSLTVVMVMCLGAIAAPAAMQAPLQSTLLVVLALDVFAGLAAAALARRGDGRESAQGEAGAAETLRWLLTAFGAAALVIAVAFALGLALNLRMAHPLLVAMGPVGALINAALIWLTSAFAYLLWIAFVKTLGALFFKKFAFYIAPPHSISSAGTQSPRHAVLAPPPAGLLIAAGVIVGVLIAVVIIAAVYVAMRVALRAIRPTPEPEMDEEREALDARGLLRRQARAWLAGLRRPPHAELDPLTPGGARWHYREILRAGAAAGLARRESETADEYSQRLARLAGERGAGPSEEAGLLELTRAYDESRYGEREVAPSAEAVAGARHTTAALTQRPGQRHTV